MKNKRPDFSRLLPQVFCSQEGEKFFLDESSHKFFKGVRNKKKSKNNYCYKCLKFENSLRVSSEGSKMLLRKK